MSLKTIPIIITYNPDLAGLERLVGPLLSQVDRVIIVDNGSRDDMVAWAAGWQEERLVVIPLGDNHGIAAAQNVGIAAARQAGADYVLLLDHDSEPEPDMVARLMDVVQTQQFSGKKVAAVGPRYHDPRRTIRPPFVRTEGFHRRRLACGEGLPKIIPVDYLIASGSLIPMATLDAVGAMREELFIDYVDIEWGLRAKQAGFQSYGACDALMRHSLGDTPLRIGRWHAPLHSPLRHYYLFRNTTWLYRQPWPPLNWKIVDGARVALQGLFYLTFAPRRSERARMIALGLWHGLTGRMGRYEGKI